MQERSNLANSDLDLNVWIQKHVLSKYCKTGREK